MPLIWMVPTKIRNKDSLEGTYNCPIYRTATRGNTLITTVNLTTSVPSVHWIRRGVAIIAENPEESSM